MRTFLRNKYEMKVTFFIQLVKNIIFLLHYILYITFEYSFDYWQHSFIISIDFSCINNSQY